MVIKNREVESLINNGYLPYPVKYQSKRPDLRRGQKPDWLTGYREKYKTTRFNGIGVFPKDGLNCVDYDLTVEALSKEGFSQEQSEEIFNKIDAIAQQILSLAVVARTGSKGFAAFFNGNHSKKDVIKITAPSGKDVTIIDLMRDVGVGIIIPPTIHPETRNQYRWLTEKTLFNTELSEHPEIPIKLLNQIIDIRDQYSIKRHDRSPKETAKKFNNNDLKLSTTYDSAYLSMGDTITLANGSQVELHEAFESHVGEYCYNPLKPSNEPYKAIINSNYIHVFNSSQTRIFPAPIDLNCKKTGESFYLLKSTKERIKEAQNQKGINLARWVFLIGKSKIYRFGFDWPSPYEWMRAYFPNLPKNHEYLINKHLKWLIDKREKESVRYYSLSRPSMILDWEDGKLPWVKAKEASEQHKLVGIRAEHGSAKTSVFAKLHTLSSQSVLAIAHRVSLTEQMADTFKADHYQERARATGRLVTCIDSLIKERSVKPHTQGVKTVVIDEAGQLRITLPTKNPEITEELGRILREAEKIILLDADLSDIDIKFFEELANCKAFTIEAKPSDKSFNTHLRIVNRGLGDISRISDHLNDGQSCVAAFSSAEKAHQCYLELSNRHPGKKIVLCARTPDGAESLERMKGAPEEFFSDVDCVLYSSAIGTGFSITNKRFTKGFAFFNCTTLSATDSIQMLRRFRAITDFDITLLMNHTHTECYQKFFTTEGVTRLRDEAVLQETHDKAYFLTAFKRLLVSRGHRITESSTNMVKIPKDQYLADKADVIASFGHVQDDCFIVNDRSYYQSKRFECQKIFSHTYNRTRTITKEMALAYCKNKLALDRYHRLTTENISNEWIDAQNIFRKILKERVKDEDCEQILTLVRKHKDSLARLRLLPDRWIGRGIPSQNKRKSVTQLAKYWGLTAKIKPSNNNYTIAISIDAVAQMIHPLKLKTTKDLKAQALELLELGFTKAQVAQRIGKSKDTIKRWSRVNGVQKDAVATNSNNTLIGAKASLCTPTDEQISTSERSKQETNFKYDFAMQTEGNEIPDFEPIDYKDTEPFCPIRELERQKDLEILLDDTQHLTNILLGEPIEIRREVTLGYIEAWRDALRGESKPHHKQNAGRWAANHWLRQRVQGDAVLM